MKKNIKKNIMQILPAITILVIVIALSLLKLGTASMEERREGFIAQKESMIHEMIMKGDYSCCLESPCTYCIEKTPKHGEGATCNCLADVMNSRAPCGECIGEIMEGHGNPHITKYFAKAIAEEMGMQHLDALRQMMTEKYGIAVEEQE